MKLDEILMDGAAPVRLAFLPFDGARAGQAAPLPPFYTRLMKAWVGLYAPPPRRPLPLL